ncbi:hypothetical protein PQE75_gp075 [Bacillus phage vB_BcoS-136]|uniref:Uncharacterized protein n=1 Tax=Bacillus phage vB_BcoS-136 TaxID=2419619 RepID=A0A3G3BVD4_9CAUD|nr:hypothetical protein PQE75_gp075 [Bacillus phage vB_BcoS-136]AYP68207.1 hypothetical protein vBBcoS136_00075 [Bacillus phage vB_BcoS-136]
MKDMSLTGLLNYARSDYAKDLNFMVIWVSGVGKSPEMIINPRENIEEKLEYYKMAYNEDLTLKFNHNIGIVDYEFVEAVELY